MKTKAHTIYKLKDGTRVVGVTTILSILNKPALVAWANGLGLQGIEVGKYVDDLANVGTLAHEMVLAHFDGHEVDYSDYSAKDKDRAENCLISFYEWIKGKKIEPIYNEKSIVSEKYRFGGTFDMYCKLDDKLTLIDFKTSAACYDEHLIQLAAYKLLLDYDDVVEQAMIVRIGRDENEGFEVRKLTDLSKYEDIFTHLLEIYKIKNQIKKGKK